MFERQRLSPKDEEELEDFQDYDDEEHAELDSKLDDYEDDEEDEDDDLEEIAPPPPVVEPVPAASAEPVDERDRPGGVREPMHRPPGAEAQAGAQQARDDDRQHQVE